MDRISWAVDLARRLLAEPLPRRWAHTQGVGRRAQAIAHVVGDDAAELVRAAWLHDIGYAPNLATTGFHPLDGAHYLRDVEQADERLCALVAHHACAVVQGRHRCADARLPVAFRPPTGLVAEALVYCDMTTGPDGRPVGAADRLDEITVRYGPGHVVSRSINEARAWILATERRIERLVATVGPLPAG